jgi:subtilisin family serine protease
LLTHPAALALPIALGSNRTIRGACVSPLDSGVRNTAADADEMRAIVARGLWALGASAAVEASSAARLHVRFQPGVDAARLAACLVWIARRPFTEWVEELHSATVANSRGVGISQAGAPGHVPYWRAGLRGEAEIIGIGDTGLDWDSCFFNDPLRPAPYDRLDLSHRKVVNYRRLFTADGSFITDGEDDEEEGHGTHVSGTVAGEASCVDAADEAALAPYNGVAYKAKIMFTDLKRSGAGMYTPEPLDKHIFAWPYSHGAFIQTNSWGSPKPQAYGGQAIDVDRS